MTSHPDDDSLKNKNKPVALIVGAGAGIGGAVAERFASGGYHVCLCRRSNASALQDAVTKIRASGACASGFLLDASKPDTVEDMIAEIESTIGPIQVAVYNLGAQIGHKSLVETSHKTFELGMAIGDLWLVSIVQVSFASHGTTPQWNLVGDPVPRRPFEAIRDNTRMLPPWEGDVFCVNHCMPNTLIKEFMWFTLWWMDPSLHPIHWGKC